MDARATWTNLSLRVYSKDKGDKKKKKKKKKKKMRRPLPNQKARSAGATRER